jgi:MscS family membrane protein
MYLFESTFIGVAIWRYIAATLLVAMSFFLKGLFERYILSGLRKFFERTKHHYDHLILETISLPVSAFMLVGGAYLALLTLGGGGGFSKESMESVTSAYWVAVTIVVVWTTFRLISLLQTYLEKEIAPKSEVIDDRLLPVINNGLKGITFVGGLLAILASFNVDAGSLLTGLGIGGLAVSLAAQDSLGNFIGSISLLADRPFKVGDRIITAGGKVDGFVEEIGFRSTRIRSWERTLFTVPNKLLASDIIDNWSNMPKRRVKQVIGVSYRTTPEQMEEIVERVNKTLKEHSGISQEFVMVRFMEFGQSSLDIMVYYFTKSIKWAEHLAVKQDVNYALMNIVREAGTSMAFPSRSIYFETPIPKEKESIEAEEFFNGPN